MQLIVEKKGSFKWSERDIQMMKTLKDGLYQVTIYTDDLRTLDQNKRYWLMIDLLSEYCGYHKDDMHEVVKIACGETTSVLNKKRHSNLHDYVEGVCNQLGIILPRESDIEVIKNF